MALFSKEYNLTMDLIDFDFSYLDEFNKLKEWQSYLEICEGFGSYGI